jgi:hypothetical protein
MPPITATATFASAKDPKEALGLCKAWLADRVSTRVVAESPSNLEVRTGSQAKMRLLGGAFIAPTSLPVRVTVTAAPTSTGSDLTITASDAVGLGVKTGMKARYRTWLDEIVTGLREAVA